MSRTPQHVLDYRQASHYIDETASSIAYLCDDKVILYTPSYMGNYKYRLYKSLDLLYEHNLVLDPYTKGLKVHRIVVKKLEPLTHYRWYRYVVPERNYFERNYISRWGCFNEWSDKKEMLSRILADPKLIIYKKAFYPLKGMHYYQWRSFWMDDHEFNFMYDRDTKRIIPIDLFI